MPAKATKPTIKKADLPKKLVEEMIDAAFNPNTWADGYTWNAWKQKYGEAMIDAVTELVIKPMRAERAKHQKALAAITKKYTGGGR